jgi:hypothetical protein
VTTAIVVRDIPVAQALEALNIVTGLLLRRTENLPTERVRSETLVVLDAIRAWIQHGHDDAVTIPLSHPLKDGQ